MEVTFVRETWQRLGLLTLAVAALALTAVVASLAATSGKTPSSAKVLEPGVPYSAVVSDSEGRYEWLRTPESFLPSDSIQFTVQSDGGTTGGADIRVCLIPATDDFGRLDAEQACDSPGYLSRYPHVDMRRGAFRRVLKWSGGRTHGFVVVTFGCGACGVPAANFTIGLERHIHAIRLGRLSFRRVGNRWIVIAPARLTDNTKVGNGHRGYVEVSYDGRKPVRASSGVVADGMFRLTFRPPRTARTATVRVCTTPIMSTARVCSVRSRVRL
jgi:hypothetical protein